MKVFIGSSKESLRVAEEVAQVIEGFGCTPYVWNDPGLFVPSTYTLEALEKLTKEVDAAIFVFNEDDKTWYRNDSYNTVRDNVLIEYGLFCGHLSRKNVCFCCTGTPRVPTDLYGIIHIDWNKPRNSRIAMEKWLESVNKKIEKPYCDIQILPMINAFATTFDYTPKISTLRIFAISAIRSVQLFRANPNIRFKKANILLREYDNNTDEYYDAILEKEINESILNWQRLGENKIIENLEINRFNYHPDEGFYIFDNSTLIYGFLHYTPSKKELKFDENLVVVKNSTTAGQDLINSYINRFDRIFNSYGKH